MANSGEIELRQKKLLKAIHDQDLNQFPELMKSDRVDKIITAEHLQLAKILYNKAVDSRNNKNFSEAGLNLKIVKAERIYSDVLKNASIKVLEKVEAAEASEASIGAVGLADDVKVLLLPKRLLNAIKSQNIDAVKLYAAPPEGSVTAINQLINGEHIKAAAEKYEQQQKAKRNNEKDTDTATQIFKIVIKATGRSLLVEASADNSPLPSSAKTEIKVELDERNEGRKEHVMRQIDRSVLREFQQRS